MDVESVGKPLNIEEVDGFCENKNTRQRPRKSSYFTGQIWKPIFKGYRLPMFSYSLVRVHTRNPLPMKRYYVRIIYEN